MKDNNSKKSKNKKKKNISVDDVHENNQNKDIYVGADYGSLNLRPWELQYSGPVNIQENVATLDQLSSASVKYVSPEITIGIDLDQTIDLSKLKLNPSEVIARSNILPFTTDPTLDKQFELENQIDNLRKELNDALNALNEVKTDKEKLASKIKESDEKKKELIKKENLRHLLSRVNGKARKKLFDSDEFRNLFSVNKIYKLVVMSIDIRRSTDLMLKAREPKLYAEFITSLCKRLANIIIENYGVFDKFTGDGILAFFPYFYSGPDAIFYALKSADESHEVFKKHYDEHRHCFSTVLKDVGLGIGIDCGDAYLTTINNELTIVGEPVVYACRFSAVEHGKTILNQPAYEEVKLMYQDHCQLRESEINVKHEGPAYAYLVDSINYQALEISPPNWDELIKEYESAE